MYLCEILWWTKQPMYRGRLLLWWNSRCLERRFGRKMTERLFYSQLASTVHFSHCKTVIVLLSSSAWVTLTAFCDKPWGPLRTGRDPCQIMFGLCFWSLNVKIIIHYFLLPQVREILGQCSCPAQFPMIKVSEGKYKVGDSSALIFIRVGFSSQWHHLQFSCLV